MRAPRRFSLAAAAIASLLIDTVALAEEDSAKISADARLFQAKANTTDSTAGRTNAFLQGVEVNATLKLDYNTHFVSYGADIWRAGSSWRSSQIGNFNPTLSFTISMEPVTIYTGAWADINTHGIPEYGDRVQEVDIWAGIGYRHERFNVGVTYQEWYYLDQTEQIVDSWLFFDDTNLLIDNFAFNPSLLVHSRVGAKYLETGSALELRLDPGFTLTSNDTSPLHLSIPVKVGFLEKGFWGGDSGFGYASVGAQFSKNLAFISTRYGTWQANAGVTYYHTEKDVIPDNPDADFLTGNIGLAINF